MSEDDDDDDDTAQQCRYQQDTLVRSTGEGREMQEHSMMYRISGCWQSRDDDVDGVR